MKRLAPAQVDQYARQNNIIGFHCPVCESRNIEGAGPDMNGNTVTNVLTCKECGTVWQEEYQLTEVFIHEKSEV